MTPSLRAASLRPAHRLLGAALVVTLVGGLMHGHGHAVAARDRTVVVGAVPLALAVASRSNRVFVANSGSNTVSVLDARTGTLLNSTAVGAEPQAVAVDEATERVFVCNMSDDTVSVLSSRSGRVLRTVAVGSGPGAVAVAARSGRVFVLNRGVQSLSVLDARRGALLRTVSLQRAVASRGLDAVTVDDATGRVFVTSEATDGNTWAITVLDAASARIDGTLSGDGDALTLAVEPHTQRVMVRSRAGAVSLRLRHALRGRQLRTVHLDAPVRAVAVDTPRGHLVVLDSQGAVRLLTGAGGTVWQRTVVPGGPALLAVDARRGRLYVLSGGWATAGQVSVLNAANGHLLRTVRVGVLPLAMTVDGATGRVFIVNGLGPGSAPVGGWAERVRAWAQQIPWLQALIAPSRVRNGSVSVLDATR